MNSLFFIPVFALSILSGQSWGFYDFSQIQNLNFKHDHGGSGRYFYVESMGGGVCLLDYDNDGDLDIYFTQGAPLPGWDKNIILENKLFRNDKTTWVDVTNKAGVGDKNYSMGCACADFDNDGDSDLYVTNFGEDIFYVNNGDGSFTEATNQLGIDNPHMGMSAAFFDSDNDGWLDLYVTNYVEYDINNNPECTSPMQYPKHGQTHARSYCDPDVFLGVQDKFYYNKNGKFIDRSSRSAINRFRLKGMGVIPGDIDNDGDMDIYVANDKDMNLLFINNGKGRFDEKSLSMGTGFNKNGLTEAGMGVDMGDLDRDGWLDIFVTNYSGETNTLYHNKQLGYFTDATDEFGLGMPSLHFLAFGTKIVDLDLDGWLDLYVANGHVIDNINLFNNNYNHSQYNQIYLNQGNGKFIDYTENMAGDALKQKVSRGAAFGDIDNDGDIDYVVANNNGDAGLFINKNIQNKNWVGFLLEGKSCNRDAIGCKIILHTGNSTQIDWVNPGGSYLTSNDKRILFGLGKNSPKISVEIIWTNSKKETYKNLKKNIYYKIIQEKGISEMVFKGK